MSMNPITDYTNTEIYSILIIIFSLSIIFRCVQKLKSGFTSY